MLKNILKTLEREKKLEMHPKINQLKHNINYKIIIKKKFPKYLEGKEKGKDRCIITRYRCRNEKANIGERMTTENAEYVEEQITEQICSIY